MHWSLQSSGENEHLNKYHILEGKCTYDIMKIQRVWWTLPGRITGEMIFELNLE